jgi:hypothetical protein
MALSSESATPGDAVVLREVEELVEVVEHPLELAHPCVHTPAAGVRRQLGHERGLARNAAAEPPRARRLLDVTPLVRVQTVVFLMVCCEGMLQVAVPTLSSVTRAAPNAAIWMPTSAAPSSSSAGEHSSGARLARVR